MKHIVPICCLCLLMLTACKPQTKVNTSLTFANKPNLNPPIVNQPYMVNISVSNPPDGGYRVEWRAKNGKVKPISERTACYTPTRSGRDTIVATILDGKNEALFNRELPVEVSSGVPPNAAVNPTNKPDDVAPEPSPVLPPVIPSEPSPPQNGVKVADFSSGSVTQGAFYTPGQGLADAILKLEPGHATGGNQLLYVTYDVTKPGSFAGAWLKGTGLDGLAELETKYRAISFRIRGDSTAHFPRDLKVEIKSLNFGWRSCYLSSLKPKFALSNFWQTVEIPASAFSSVAAYDKQINELVFCFENEVLDARSGAVFIDDIYLIKK